MWKSKYYGAFVLNHRVVLHAIDATPARWRGDAGSSPLDRASAAASSPGNDFHTVVDGKRQALPPRHGRRLAARRLHAIQVPPALLRGGTDRFAAASHLFVAAPCLSWLFSLLARPAPSDCKPSATAAPVFNALKLGQPTLAHRID